MCGVKWRRLIYVYIWHVIVFVGCWRRTSTPLNFHFTFFGPKKRSFKVRFPLQTIYMNRRIYMLIFRRFWLNPFVTFACQNANFLFRLSNGWLAGCLCAHFHRRDRKPTSNRLWLCVVAFFRFHLSMHQQLRVSTLHTYQRGRRNVFSSLAVCNNLYFSKRRRKRKHRKCENECCAFLLIGCWQQTDRHRKPHSHLFRRQWLRCKVANMRKSSERRKKTKRKIRFFFCCCLALAFE